MDTTHAAALDAAVDHVEGAVRRLLDRCAALQEENALLHEQLRQVRTERAAAKERTEQARQRVESMISRLRTMEHPE